MVPVHPATAVSAPMRTLRHLKPLEGIGFCRSSVVGMRNLIGFTGSGPKLSLKANLQAV